MCGSLNILWHCLSLGCHQGSPFFGTGLVHGILQARILEWVGFPFSRGSFQPRESNPGFPNCRRILYQLSYKGSPRILEWVAYPFSRGSSRCRNRTGVSLMRKPALLQGGNMSRSPSQQDSLRSQAQLLMNIDREKKRNLMFP